MSFMRQLQSWHKTTLGHLVFGLVELSLAFLCVNLAIDSGSLWQWALTIILVVGFFQNFVRAILGKLQ